MSKKQSEGKTSKMNGTKRPCFSARDWVGSNSVQTAVWTEEVTLENGKDVLDHQCKVTVGYRTKDGTYKDKELWLSATTLLRLAKQLDEADTHVSDANRKHRENRRAA